MVPILTIRSNMMRYAQNMSRIGLTPMLNILCINGRLGQTTLHAEGRWSNKDCHKRTFADLLCAKDATKSNNLDNLLSGN